MAISAVIDLGTNTFRLLIAEISTDGDPSVPRLKPIYSENRIVRLGEGFGNEKRLVPAAIDRALSALTAFNGVLQNYAVQHLSAVGTSALRDASNQEIFLKAVKERLGWDVRVISGEEEARMTFLGANLILQHREGPMVLVDIGGGSTELIVAEGETPRVMISLPLGVVRLTEQYLRSDPPTPNECRALQTEITKILRDAFAKWPQKAFFAGTAGTLTTLAAIDQEMACYDLDKINRYPLSKKAIERILTKLLSLPLSARCGIPGLEKGREDLIIAGIFILLALMEQGNYDPVIVSDYGLREGVAAGGLRAPNERSGGLRAPASKAASLGR